MLLGCGFVWAYNASEGYSCEDCGVRKAIQLDVPNRAPEDAKPLDGEVELTVAVDDFEFVLDDQEDENRRLLLQRDLRLKTSLIRSKHLVKGKMFTCVVTFTKSKPVKIDDCGEDYIAKRIVEKELTKLEKGMFERQGFENVDSVSVTLGNNY
ncbi:hypothetical protein KJB35_17735 [Vibrio sp. D431a]|nr:hypothetical protein [Vibrio sp. D431a]